MAGVQLFLLLICCFSTGVISFGSFTKATKKCQWLKNMTKQGDDFMTDKNGAAVEECLWYKISEDVTKSSGIPGALFKIPPSNYPSGNDKVTIFIHDFILESFRGPNDFQLSSEVKGRLLVSWMDNRFHWDTKEWKVNSINIKSGSDIWLPEPVDVYFMHTRLEPQGELRFLNIKASITGNVTSQLKFTAATECQSDETNYPMETSHCCIKLGQESYNPLREYQVENYRSQMAGTVDFSTQKSLWTLKNLRLTVQPDDSQQIQMCLEASRSSVLLKMELLLPMMASAVFLLASPCFGSLKAQAYVKMFALLVQILCFQFLLRRQSATWFKQVPKIFRFYEITLGTTLASLILTVLINSLNKFKQNLPPPHRLQLVSGFVNRYLCCSSSTSSIDYRKNPTNQINAGMMAPNTIITKSIEINGGGVGTSSSSSHEGDRKPCNTTEVSIENIAANNGRTTPQTKKNFRREWSEIFSSLNYLVSMIVLVLYVFILLFTCF